MVDGTLVPLSGMPAPEPQSRQLPGVVIRSFESTMKKKTTEELWRWHTVMDGVGLNISRTASVALAYLFAVGEIFTSGSIIRGMLARSKSFVGMDNGHRDLLFRLRTSLIVRVGL